MVPLNLQEIPKDGENTKPKHIQKQLHAKVGLHVVLFLKAVADDYISILFQNFIFLVDVNF